MKLDKQTSSVYIMPGDDEGAKLFHTTDGPTSGKRTKGSESTDRKDAQKHEDLAVNFLIDKVKEDEKI